MIKLFKEGWIVWVKLERAVLGKGIVPLPGKDDVVQERYVKEVAGGADARRLPDVIQAGASLAGRVVVEDDDRGCVVYERPLHDRP